MGVSSFLHKPHFKPAIPREYCNGTTTQKKCRQQMQVGQTNSREASYELYTYDNAGKNHQNRSNNEPNWASRGRKGRREDVVDKTCAMECAGVECM